MFKASVFRNAPLKKVARFKRCLNFIKELYTFLLLLVNFELRLVVFTFNGFIALSALE